MQNIYVDASAVLAIILNEAEQEAFTAKISCSKCYISAVSQYEIISGLCHARKRNGKAVLQADIARAIQYIADFLTYYKFKLIPIAEAEAQAAARAYMLYGKGTGAKANLNMGDCFSYACAAAHSLPLLYKGNDFIHTDIACA